MNDRKAAIGAFLGICMASALAGCSPVAGVTGTSQLTPGTYSGAVAATITTDGTPQVTTVTFPVTINQDGIPVLDGTAMVQGAEIETTQQGITVTMTVTKATAGVGTLTVEISFSGSQGTTTITGTGTQVYRQVSDTEMSYSETSQITATVGGATTTVSVTATGTLTR